MENSKITVYDSAFRLTFPQFLKKAIREIFVFRSAWKNFVQNGLRIRYRRSVLGFFWTLLNPLFSLAIITLAFSYIFGRDIKTFGIFLFAGMLPYQFMNNAAVQATESLVTAEGYLKRVYLPKLLFPLISVSIEFVNFIFSLFALYFIALLFGAGFSPTIFLLPLVIIILFFFSFGLGLVLSILDVFFRDLPNIVKVVFNAVFYATPVIYTIDRFPANIQSLFNLNPLVYFVNLSRMVILGGQPILFWDWMIPILIDLVLLLIGFWLMMKNSEKIVYRL